MKILMENTNEFSPDENCRGQIQFPVRPWLHGSAATMLIHFLESSQYWDFKAFSHYLIQSDESLKNVLEIIL